MDATRVTAGHHRKWVYFAAVRHAPYPEPPSSASQYLGGSFTFWNSNPTVLNSEAYRGAAETQRNGESKGKIVWCGN